MLFRLQMDNTSINIFAIVRRRCNSNKILLSCRSRDQCTSRKTILDIVIDSSYRDSDLCTCFRIMWYEFEPLLTSGKLRSSSPNRVNFIFDELYFQSTKNISEQTKSEPEILSEVAHQQSLKLLHLSQVGFMNDNFYKSLSKNIFSSCQSYISGMNDYEYYYKAQGFKFE